MGSNSKTVLVSGINGYVASVIGLDLLKKGYTLRGTSRSTSSKAALLDGPYKDYADRFDVVAVPDIIIPGAFDEAVKGVHVILHTASPVDFSLKTLDDFLNPASKGALGILDSALNHAGPQLEAFVLTSSVASVANASKPKDYAFSEADWNTFAEAKARELGDDKATAALFYPASKAAAEKNMWEWVDKNKPPFSVSAVNPAVVTGPPVSFPADPARFNETLKPIWRIFSGQAKTIPPGVGSMTYIDVRDVSAVQIWCMEHPKESNGQRYLLTNGRGTMQAAADILREAYPDRHDIVKGEPGSDYIDGYGYKEGEVSFKATKAKKEMGVEFIRFDQSIKDTAEAMERYL